MKQIFLPEHSLGLLEPVFQNTISERSKRGRRVGFSEYVKTLKGLKLIKRIEEVSSVSFGLNSAGELGLFVLLHEKDKNSTTKLGQIGATGEKQEEEQKQEGQATDFNSRNNLNT